MDARPAPSLMPARWLALLCAAVALAGAAWTAWDMFAPAQRPMLQGWDDSFYYFWLPSVVIDHDLDFSNQLAHSGSLDATAQAEALAQPRTRTGFLPNKYPPGWALGSLPFFAVVHLFTPAGSNGFEPAYLVVIWLGQLLYAAIGLWLAVEIVSRYFARTTAAIAVFTAWLASPLVYYQGARLSMSHSQVFVLAMLVTWTAFRIWDGDRRGRNWMLLGLAAALLIVTRNLAAVYLIWPALVVARRLRSWPAAAWLVAGAVVPVLTQLLAWKILHGSWLAYSYGDERFDFSQLHLREVLFSARHGWFYWHPLMLAGIAGFVAWAWRRIEGRAWLGSLVAIVLLNAAWPMWWLGSSFGHRGFEVCTFFAAIGLAQLAHAVRAAGSLRKAFTLLVTLCIVWNLALFALFLTQRISRDQPVTYLDSARALVGWITGERS